MICRITYAERDSDTIVTVHAQDMAVHLVLTIHDCPCGHGTLCYACYKCIRTCICRVVAYACTEPD